MTTSSELPLLSPQLSSQTSTFTTEKCPVEIKLDNLEARKHTPLHKKNGNMIYVPLFTVDDANIEGSITVCQQSKSFPYVRVCLIGRVEFYSINKKGFNFLEMVQDLGKAKKADDQIAFKFSNFPKNYETYNGFMCAIKYYILAIVTDSNGEQNRHEQEIALHIPSPPPNPANMFTLQIGVMEVVEVDLAFKKTDFHLQECITGRVLIHLAKVDIKKIELYLIKVECSCYNAKSKIKEEVLKKLVLKEGQPKKGEIIPIKLYLGTLDLSPTMRSVEGVLDVKYYLTLGLIDSNERMFFRKLEINLRRAFDDEI